MVTNKSKLFQVMGLGPVWHLKQSASQAHQSTDGLILDEVVPVSSVEPMPLYSSLEALASCVRTCEACGLSGTRTQTVFADGVPQADLMVIGEAPGADEDVQGLPFVGRAGQLLDKMLFSIHRTRRENTYIANVLKCRPPGNRNPSVSEVDACFPFLKTQVQFNQPKVLLLLGRFAVQALLNTDASIAQLRGRVHAVDIEGKSIPAVVGYHPAYLLRRPEEKRKAWNDLLLLRQALEG